MILFRKEVELPHLSRWTPAGEGGGRGKGGNSGEGEDASASWDRLPPKRRCSPQRSALAGEADEEAAVAKESRAGLSLGQLCRSRGGDWRLVESRGALPPCPDGGGRSGQSGGHGVGEGLRPAHGHDSRHQSGAHRLLQVRPARRGRRGRWPGAPGEQQVSLGSGGGGDFSQACRGGGVLLLLAQSFCLSKRLAGIGAGWEALEYLGKTGFHGGKSRSLGRQSRRGFTAGNNRAGDDDGTRCVD